MQIKTPLLVIGSIILLSLIIVFLGSPNNSQRDRALVEAGNAGAVESAAPSARDLAAADPGFEALYQKVNAASPAEFEAIAYEVMSTAPREQVNMFLELLLARWIEKDLAAALDFAGNLGDKTLREALLRYTLIKGGRVDFPATLDWVNRHIADEEEKYNLITAFFEGVAKESPEYALQFVELLADENFKDHIIRVLLEQWAKQDMVSAFAWANDQGSSSPVLDNAKASFLFRLMNLDPQEAGALIRNMPAGEQKEALARRYADELAKEDIEAAAAWARTLDDPNSYGVALSTAYEAWFRKEPDKKIIMEQVLIESDSSLRDRLINEIALDMANSNPAELAGMLDKLPDSAQLDVAEKAVRFWKERDPSATLEWVNGLNPGIVKDRTSAVMAEDLVIKGRRDEALMLAGAIGDQSLRYESAKKVLEYWYQVKPDEAQRVVHGVPYLSEAEKESISSLIQ